MSGVTLDQADRLSEQPPPTSLKDCSDSLGSSTSANQASSGSSTGANEASLGLPTSANEACSRRLNNTEFAVQIYRGQLNVNSAGLVLAYPVQVRVYSAQAVPVTSSETPIGEEPAAMTSSIVGAETRPLAVLTTQIIRSDSAQTLCRLTNCS
ncbi:MAG TPA: hypothetical protein IGP91_10325 [Thermosynechococcus sp. M46_R2017_013]|nr:hypothetical protein [Thermosynechococcus sp. M46_R2017_013]